MPVPDSSVTPGSPTPRTVDDQYYSPCPECDAREQGTVTQERFGWAPTSLVAVNQIEIAKNPVDREREGPGQTICPELRNGGWLRRVDGIAYQRRAPATIVISCSRSDGV